MQTMRIEAGTVHAGAHIIRADVVRSGNEVRVQLYVDDPKDRKRGELVTMDAAQLAALQRLLVDAYNAAARLSITGMP